MTCPLYRWLEIAAWATARSTIKTNILTHENGFWIRSYEQKFNRRSRPLLTTELGLEFSSAAAPGFDAAAL